MKKLILFLILFSFSAHASTSNTVMLVSPLVQLEERSLPASLDKNYLSYSGYYLANYPKEKNVEGLLKEFENAQKYYLVNSKDFARQYFEKVVDYADIDEWRDVHRKIIYLSYLRLSELNPEDQTEWILKALRFSLDTDPKSLNISKSLYSKIQEIKKDFLKDTIGWQVSQFKSDFNFILINGHVIDLRKIEVVKIPAGKFRVTFLSDVYKLQTYQVSSQQIPLLVPTRIPFVSGSCEKPFVNNEGEIHSKIAVYYSKNCIKTLTAGRWLGINQSKVKDVTNSVAPAEFTLRTESYQEPFYKQKWFLVAMGVIAASAAISMFNSQKEKPTHETVNGF